MRGFYPLKDKYGKQIYTAIFLKEIIPDMYKFKKGDLWFVQKYKKHILCRAVHDDKIVSGIKLLNHKIEIIECIE